MNSKEDFAKLVAFILAAIVFVAVGMGIGAGIECSRIRRKAVIEGAAEWVTNEHGEPQFQWKAVE